MDRLGSEIKRVLILGAGTMGGKTGQGFYHYPHPAFLSPEFMEGI